MVKLLGIPCSYKVQGLTLLAVPIPDGTPESEIANLGFAYALKNINRLNLPDKYQEISQDSFQIDQNERIRDFGIEPDCREDELEDDNPYFND